VVYIKNITKLRFLATLGLAVIFPLACFARLGESIEKCAERYGKPVEDEINFSSFFVEKDKSTVEAKDPMVALKHQVGELVVITLFYKDKNKPDRDHCCGILYQFSGDDSAWDKRNELGIRNIQDDCDKLPFHADKVPNVIYEKFGRKFPAEGFVTDVYDRPNGIFVYLASEPSPRQVQTLGYFSKDMFMNIVEWQSRVDEAVNNAHEKEKSNKLKGL